MTRLDWSAVGERIYEAGVDQGVLYVGTNPGVPWTGLVSITESPSGVDNKTNYIDGVKYLNRLSGEEFEATIEAYTYPEEFAQCDGSLSVGNGLFAAQQKRRPFGLSYRTMVGNDTNGLDHGYKIHIVYDALAEPSEHANETLSDSSDAFNFSWHITTRPPRVSGIRPTAHFVIDSRKTPEGLLGFLEDILYGNALNIPRLPEVGELIYYFTSFASELFDAGGPLEVAYYTYDGGPPTPNQTTTLNGGTP